MNYFGAAVLLLWLPIVVMVFQVLPPKKAVAFCFITAWLFLPNGGFALPGLPDYTKMTATVIGVLLCAVLFDSGRLFSIRFRWYDIPMTIWCVGIFASAVTNGLGAYEGCSALLDSLVYFGFPYLLGRVYLDDAEALKDFARAIVIGGLCYIPFCVFENRFSPMLHFWIYGYATTNLNFVARFGGYRPSVFLSTGLELGMWMTNSSLLCYVLWYFGTIKEIRGFSIGKLLLALIATALLCKSLGALCLLAFGIAIIGITRRFQRTWLIWLTIAISPAYCFARTLDLWSGQDVVEIAKATVGNERAQSFEFRLGMERQLADHALNRPFLGWGRTGNALLMSSDGKKLVTIPDGFWIIVLGAQGLVGLSCLIALFSLPMILTIRRYPLVTWRDPQVGPVVGISVVLLLTMVDFLSNAMLMPLFPLAIGGILSQLPYRSSGGHIEAEDALSVASEFTGEGRIVEASQEFHRAIELSSHVEDAPALRIRAEALDGLGHSYMAFGQLEESVAAFREALVIRDELAAEFHDDDHFRDLAIARDGLSRALAESGKAAEAVEERHLGLQIWEVLAANHPKDAGYRDYQVNTLNDLAWLLATDPDPSPRDPARALALAEEAVRISPDHEALWNTLGVARYRAGQWTGAIEALERSIIASPGGDGTAFDHYFLAMAWCQLRREDLAGEWLERGTAWAARHRPGHPALDRFREEAGSLLRGEA
jgi:tetratricopeptide (TPR) repeat protein